jgi:two-component system sensor histidine kinase KdpD
MAQLSGALAAVAAVTLVYARWLQVSNAATVSVSFLLVVLLVAAMARLWVAIATSLVAMLSVNYFFLPPVGTFTIAEPHNWVALFVFLAVSLVASNLSASARSRAEDALARRDELARLFDLSRDVLLLDERRGALGMLARAIARRFDLEYVAIALPDGDGWEVHAAGVPDVELDRTALTTAFASARTSLEFDATTRTYAGHRELSVAGRSIRLVPLRALTTPIGLLAASGRTMDAGTLDTLAGIVALAVERTTLLADRSAGELSRQREELTAALLASLGHDLRTPLTAIRLAADNLLLTTLPEGERREQHALILGEVERLTRLFASLLDMARLDAGPVQPDVRAVHPSEIIAAARDQVAHALGRHTVDVSLEGDDPVRVDPRLCATALAHVLENAAHYSPAGSSIRVLATRVDGDLRVSVLDSGPGIDAADMAHLFDRFYRGASGVRRRASGTGMGLWIARGLLAAQGGRIWAENRHHGGARFTIAVPAADGRAA